MASVGLLALVDDIATLLDDIAILSKVAAKKTAGVLGDDLALNAQQVTGVKADRELPVVWAVAKGSFLNKLILVPLALLISAFLPWLITPLLMLGGAYLCYEGFEKIAHRWLHAAESDQAHQQALTKAIQDENVDIVAFEKQKIKGAIRTDFILSAEIIVLALGVTQGADFLTQALTVSVVAVLITIVVYGLVAGIVRLDDGGLALIKSVGQGWFSRFKRTLGYGMVSFAPKLMKFLSVLGMVAMFLVGGGIIVHGTPFLQTFIEAFSDEMVGWGAMLFSLGSNGLVGLVVGAFVLLVVLGASRLKKSLSASK
ncbi:DUF808 domain-containing protein [Hydrogenovibrio sp. 3SP14C1]|uniref:DUF808 domain-containing protein n=1 Tax=Hydrogenovibrio sp. 3SP14C1 TaxID=3038774 RepID=UPI0024160BE9|nr:DUF808 domain-containing protein [Hydrogenovibrio sp. 3SP14C1]MDG4812525.1 DUF808 domain-containing protein [Hydrogenovibrio sp. 3SP14C1]